MLPKSLHTVRILTAVARECTPDDAGPALRVAMAAEILGYPCPDPNDPLIVKAAAALLKQVSA